VFKSEYLRLTVLVHYLCDTSPAVGTRYYVVPAEPPSGHRHLTDGTTDVEQPNQKEEGDLAMERSIDPRLKLTLSMLRDLVNKLAVISGHCDLLSDHLKDGSQCAQRVSAVQDIAREMAKDLDEYYHQLLESRSTGIEELDVA
jgi:hypothetical protein